MSLSRGYSQVSQKISTFAFTVEKAASLDYTCSQSEWALTHIDD